MRNREETGDQAFKSGLEDVHHVLTRLSHLCQNLDELTELIGLAIGTSEQPGNGAQLQILKALLADKPAPQPQARVK